MQHNSGNDTHSLLSSNKAQYMELNGPNWIPGENSSASSEAARKLLQHLLV